MANTTKGTGKAKKKTSAAGTAKKKQTKTTARKTTTKKSSTAKRTSGAKKNTVREPMDEGVRAEIILLCVLAFSILLMLSNFGMGGVIGQAVCDFFFGLFGVTEWAAPVLIFFGTAFYIANRENFLIVRKTGGAVSCFVFFCAFMQLLTSGYTRDTSFLDYYFDSAYDHLGGGILGGFVVKLLGMGFGQIGAWVIIVIAIIISVIVMTQKPIFAPIQEKTNDRRRMAEERRQERLARRAAMEEEEKELILEEVEEPKKEKKKKSRLLPRVDLKAELNENDDTNQMEMPELSIHRGSVPAEEPEKAETVAEEPKKEKAVADHARNPRSSQQEIEADVDGIRQEIGKKAEEKRPEYKTPPMNLLKKGTRGAMGDSDAHLREVARKLEETLDSFGVKVTVNNVSCGPTVTRYELMPEQGVKVSRIVGLTDDIKLSLAAADVRIEAPIPGKSAVGIEVPNKTNTAVMLRDLLETPEFKNFSSNLAFAVGKDIAGQPVIADIAKMPHLLIAGATGSGKSVCINTLIMSIIYKAKPEDVKLIMIDPKVVELSVYNGIPHLFIPVVTDPKKASGALNWAVAEMTDRYNKFAEFNVRDMKGYNAKVAELPPDENGKKPEKLPQIVIIVDELADLMMVAPGEVEDAICRLAQLARAAGIHLIIATQRPSVNVITGLIKANMPSRIAFSVSSSVDSRTILDMGGAEKLLGKGDMLYKPQDYQKPARLQGSFVSDKEVSDVVAYLKNHYGENAYDPDIEKRIHTVSLDGGSAAGGGDDRDNYFVEAGKFIIEKDKASIGMLQRVLKIGFNRAARIMDQLADAGVVGPEEGTKPRKVLMSMEQFENYLEEHG